MPSFLSATLWLTCSFTPIKVTFDMTPVTLMFCLSNVKMAEKVERPQVATTPLDLFENRYNVEAPFLNKYWIPAVSGTIAFTAVCYANWLTKRPVLSGMHNLNVVVLCYVIFFAGGCRSSEALGVFGGCCVRGQAVGQLEGW